MIRSRTKRLERCNCALLAGRKESMIRMRIDRRNVRLPVGSLPSLSFALVGEKGAEDVARCRLHGSRVDRELQCLAQPERGIVLHRIEDLAIIQ